MRPGGLSFRRMTSERAGGKGCGGQRGQPGHHGHHGQRGPGQRDRLYRMAGTGSAVRGEVLGMRGELLTLSPSHRGWPLYCHRCQIATRCRAELATAYERENEGRGGDGEPVRRRIRAGLTLLLVFPTNCTAALSINESALSLNEMALSLNEMGTDD